LERADEDAAHVYLSFKYIYGRWEAAMAKRLVDIDDALLSDAQSILGTTTYKETVNQALSWVVRQRRVPLRDTPEVLAAFAEATADLSDPDVMRAAWG
jgi:Arc/MetJ family transcription regulator